MENELVVRCEMYSQRIHDSAWRRIKEILYKKKKKQEKRKLQQVKLRLEDREKQGVPLLENTRLRLMANDSELSVKYQSSSPPP